MKNKSLVIILCILSFIVLMVILSSTVFCLKNVELNFLSKKINLNSDDEIIQSVDFEYNKSIFFLSKKKYMTELEQKNPYIKIINIETIFPNKIRINCVERNELFALKGFENSSFKSYMILDREGKVLDNQNDFSNTHLNSISLVVDNSQEENVKKGQTISSSYNNLIKSLANELFAYQNNVLLLKANFEEIIINYNSSDDIKIKMRSGTTILLKEISSNFSEKFMLGLSTYDDVLDKTNSEIVIFKNSEGKVVGNIY